MQSSSERQKIGVVNGQTGQSDYRVNGRDLPLMEGGSKVPRKIYLAASLSLSI